MESTANLALPENLVIQALLDFLEQLVLQVGVVHMDRMENVALKDLVGQREREVKTEQMDQ